MRMLRRPRLSASRPSTKAPISMPRKNTVPVCSASGTVSEKVAAIEAAVKPTASTCMASAAQTRPKMPSSRR